MSEDMETMRAELWALRGKLSEQEQAAQHRALEDAHWPPALIKAVDDPFDYAVGLKDGTTIFFEYAVPCGKDSEWVSLMLNDMHSGSNAYRQAFNYKVGVGRDRGLEVRISEIVWASDAPYGS